MNKFSAIRYGFLPVALATLLASGCADDATRMERAKAFADDQEYRAATIELKNVLQSDAANTEARVMLGEISLRNGDSATAIKELKRARELGAPPDLYAPGLARALLREGRYQEVVNLNPALADDPAKRAALHALIALAQIELGELAAAGESLAAALKLSPEQPDALMANAKLSQKQGDPAAAMASLDLLLSQTPDDPEALAALAQQQLQTREYAAAEQSFRKALDRLAGTGRAHERMVYMSGLIESQLAQNKIGEAQANSARMIESTAQHPLALFQAARADFAAKDYDAAISKAERIVTSHPAAEPPRMLLAASAIAKGDRMLAATHLQSAVNINPGNEMARKLLAQVRIQLGDPEEALALLEPLIAAGTQDPRILTMAATASIRSGDPAGALRLAEQGMQMDVDDPTVVLQAAANFLVAGDIDRAIEVLDALPEAERVGHRELLLILALLRKGDTSGARAQVASVVASRPDAADSHRLMGGFHLAVGELDEARGSFQRALEIDPDDTAALVNLARVEVAQDKPQQAEALFRSLLERKPGDLVALTGLAQLAERRGNVNEGVRLLEQAREANPKAVVPLLTLGRYYLNVGKVTLAEERATQAVRAAPGNAEAQTLLGVVLTEDGRPTEAITVFERAIEANPNLALAHYHLGRAQSASGLEDAGYDSYERAVELDGSFFPARVALVTADVKRGDLKKALATAESLAVDYPDRAEPLMLRGDVHVARNDPEAALASYEQAATIQPSRAAAAKRAELKKRLGRDRYWEDLERWVENNPDDNVAHAILGQSYGQAGLTDRAIASYERAMEILPQAPVATRLAILHRDAGDLDAAVASLQKAMELDPNDIGARAALTSIELRRGNTDRAMKLARELSADHPNNADVLVLEGDVLLETGNYKGSMEAYDRAANLQPAERTALKRYEARRQAGRDDAWRVLESWYADHPGHADAGILLAQDYTGREWYDEAIETYRSVLATDPTNLIALNNIAWVYDQRRGDGDALRAVNAAKRAYEQQPDLAAVADTYGWVLLQNEQAGEALPLLRKAASADDTDPEIRYHLAAALEANGEDAEAAAVLDELLGTDVAFDSREDAEALRRRLTP